MDVRAEIKRFTLRDIVGESGIDVKDFADDRNAERRGEIRTKRGA
jgi:hypothetical protein